MIPVKIGKYTNSRIGQHKQLTFQLFLTETLEVIFSTGNNQNYFYHLLNLLRGYLIFPKGQRRVAVECYTCNPLGSPRSAGSAAKTASERSLFIPSSIRRLKCIFLVVKTNGPGQKQSLSYVRISHISYLIV